MTTTDLLRSRPDHILQVATEYGARNVRVFGSVARGGNHRGIFKRHSLSEPIGTWMA